MTSVGGSQGLLCARHCWFQPTPRCLTWRLKLSPTAKHVVPVKTFRKGQNRKDGTIKWEEKQCHRCIRCSVEDKVLLQSDRSPWLSWCQKRDIPEDITGCKGHTLEYKKWMRRKKKKRDKLLHPDPDHLLHCWRDWMWRAVTTDQWMEWSCVWKAGREGVCP